ncbi:hypothetical protein ACIF6L_26395 [Kitasatospora sp. NPDC086009]|uniref:hypothetical protein n=1 Tax=unclassified Kitasatospora TaxID=2633591 RepID=UPI0037C95A3D
MTRINLTKTTINRPSVVTLTVKPSAFNQSAAFVGLADESAHMTEAETRRLRDELTNILGENEPAPASEPIKVGDRVVVVREYPARITRLDGQAGVVESLDPGDRYPYLVAVDGEEYSAWCHSVRRETTPAEVDEDPELADHIRVSAAQDAADVDRRHSAAVKARDILSFTAAGPFGIRAAVDPEAVIRLADWLLGETA